jgi:hypothetical protein
MFRKKLSDLEKEYLRKITTLEDLEKFLAKVENHLKKLEEDLKFEPYLSKKEKLANQLLSINIFLILSNLQMFVEESRNLENADDELRPIFEEFYNQELQKLSQVMPVFKNVKKLPKHLENKILSLANKADKLESLYGVIIEGLLDEPPFKDDFKPDVFH